MIYTQIGVYKGRIFAVKKVRKKSIDITREMKKELKMVSTVELPRASLDFIRSASMTRIVVVALSPVSSNFSFQMRDLRHDNLNPFIGACTDPPNICIIVEYCARGSLKVGDYVNAIRCD